MTSANTKRTHAIREAILDCLICSVDSGTLPDHFTYAAYTLLVAFRKAYADEIIEDAKIGRSEFAAFKRHFNPIYMGRLIEDLTPILGLEGKSEQFIENQVVYVTYNELIKAL